MRATVPAAAAAIAALAVLAAGCASSSTASSSTSPPATAPAATPSLASANVGSMRITGGYVVQPASPDVASAYMTLTNSGDQADTLQKATSSAASDVMAMTESDSGGVGSMSDLANVTIPAHGSMQFRPNHAHLMLEKPQPIKAGQHVNVTLTFARAGTVTVDMPVLAYGETPEAVPSTMTMAPGQSMPGMSMNP